MGSERYIIENDEIRAKPRRSMEDLKAFRSTGTSSWYASSDHPSIVKSPPPPPPPRKKGELYCFKSGIDTLLRVPISSPEAVLLPRQVDHEFKDSRDS